MTTTRTASDILSTFAERATLVRKNQAGRALFLRNGLSVAITEMVAIGATRDEWLALAETLATVGPCLGRTPVWKNTCTAARDEILAGYDGHQSLFQVTVSLAYANI
jgi:hypothetical protein